VVEGTDASLARLGLSYVDLIFCHRPDLHTPLEETVRAMNHVLDQGKALYWGTSEWSARQILDAWHLARRERLVPPLMEQPEYNMLHRERVEGEYAPLYDSIGLCATIWSPLAGGLLTGKYNDGVPPDSRGSLAGYEWLRDRFAGDKARLGIARVRELEPVAQKLGCTMAQLAIAWCAANPAVSTVITGASRPQQVEENMAALEVVPRLTETVMAEIDGILGNRPKPGVDWRAPG
jgi:voltage-dependent potassium channel beta subunit